MEAYCQYFWASGDIISCNIVKHSVQAKELNEMSKLRKERQKNTNNIVEM